MTWRSWSLSRIMRYAGGRIRVAAEVCPSLTPRTRRQGPDASLDPGGIGPYPLPGAG